MKAEAYPFPWRFEGYRYPDFYLMSRIEEARVQAEILEMLRAYAVDAIAIDAGGRRIRGRMMAAARSAGIALGGVVHAKTGAAIPAGFADLEATLAPTGRSLYIEVKAPAWIDAGKKVIRRAGQPTPEQIEFLLAKHRRGALCMVAWSATDVEGYLGTFLRGNWAEMRAGSGE
jgi:hypothetical protein